jgi:sister chromatid cohesion protein DCC1
MDTFILAAALGSHRVYAAAIADSSLTIKGTPSDDAVLCTPTSTFLLRTITLSNSLLICRTPESSSSAATTAATLNENGKRGRDQLEIRGIEHQVLECVPQAADLERIRRLLRESQWEGLELGLSGGEGRKQAKRGRKWTKAQLESVVQASPAELDRGLRERNVIEVDGTWRIPRDTSQND